ncbi:MAG: hypothetical protein R3C59_03140 [Planctomycetaceae bacterium]
MNNVVGKMLIVMSLVFSILFMCFAGAVYTFQGQWRSKALETQKELEVARQQTEDAIEERNREKAALEAERDQFQAAAEQLRADQDRLKTQAQNFEALLAEAKLVGDKARSESLVATIEAAARVKEATVLNKEVRSLQNRNAELFDRLQKLEDERLSLNGRLAAAEEKEEEHLAENGRLKDLLRLNEIDPRQVVVGDVPPDREKVDGFVTSTRRNKSRTQEYIGITVGSDDGISKDMKVTVFTGDKYKARARVYTVYPDSAVCIVDEDTRQGTIEEGDNVTTKF